MPEKPIEITDSVLFQVKLRSLEQFYIYIKVKDKPTPIRARFKSRDKECNIKIFVSNNKPFPSYNNCDEVFTVIFLFY